MKHANLVKAFEKAGLKVVQDPNRSNSFSVPGEKYSASWYTQTNSEGEVETHSVYVKPNDQEDDLMTDYWAGSFRDTIKGAVESVSGKVDSQACDLCGTVTQWGSKLHGGYYCKEWNSKVRARCWHTIRDMHREERGIA